MNTLPEALMDDDRFDTQALQRQEELEQEFYLLAALQRIDRAGFHDEALLFAFHGGVLTQFKKELEHARKG